MKAGNERLMGFGHRVYKNYDPRARIIKRACDDVFEVTGVNPLLAIATELEKIALEDEYFISRKLYPNVDFYSGLIYEALGMPMSMFPVMFAIGRTSGWIAQWLEMVQDSEQKIARPRQIYTGERARDYVPLDARVVERDAPGTLTGPRRPARRARAATTTLEEALARSAARVAAARAGGLARGGAVLQRGGSSRAPGRGAARDRRDRAAGAGRCAAASTCAATARRRRSPAACAARSSSSRRGESAPSTRCDARSAT